MGCGGSRLNPDAVAIPQSIRPILNRRLEEIKRRRRARGLKDDVTPSKKELLGGDEVEEVSSLQQPAVLDMKGSSLSSPAEDNSISFVTPPEESEGGPEKRVGEDSNRNENDGNSTAKEAESITEETNNAIARNGTGGDVKDGGKDEVGGGGGGDDGSDTDDERKLRRCEDEFYYPGSPSFRVYYLENLRVDDINDDDHDLHYSEKDDGFGEEIVPTIEAKAALQEVDDEPKKVKKRRRMRSFRKVLPRGDQVKKLFDVQSCYTSSHGGRDTHLLVGKSAA